MNYAKSGVRVFAKRHAVSRATTLLSGRTKSLTLSLNPTTTKPGLCMASRCGNLRSMLSRGDNHNFPEYAIAAVSRPATSTKTMGRCAGHDWLTPVVRLKVILVTLAPAVEANTSSTRIKM